MTADLKNLLKLVFWATFLTLIVGCSTPVRVSDRPIKSFVRDPMQVARISCYLALEKPDGLPVRMEVSRLELLAGDTWLPLLKKPQVFDSVELGSGQIFVGALNVPPGNYRRLRMQVDKAEALNAGTSYVEVLSEPRWFEISMSSNQAVGVDDSKTLLFSWDANGSLDAKNRFAPAINVWSSKQPIWSDLVFVSCPEIDTVFIVRADTNRVVASFGLKGAPTYMVMDPDSDNRRLIVLCSRERMIKIVDLETYRVADFFAVPLTDDPSDMKLSPDGRSLYLLDEEGGYLTRMDPVTGQILARSFLDFRPSYLLYLQKQNLLAVSLALSQKVVLVDPLNLKIVGEYLTGNSPAGLLGVDNQLYIAERGDHSVRVVDLTTRSEQNRLIAGLGPRRLIAAGSQVYISNSIDQSLSVMESGGISIVQHLRGFSRPGEMALNSFYRRLFVADEEADALKVVDVNSNRIIRRIDFGAMPFGLTVIQ